MSPSFDLRVPADSGAAHTCEEIAQQPAVWREVAGALRADEATQAFLAPLVAETDRRIILTGAGTSALGGAMIAPILSEQLGRPVEAIATTDIVSRSRDAFGPEDRVLLVSFARSGNSPESVAATELATRLTANCRHLIVTCASDGRLASDHRDRPGSRLVLLPDRTNDRGFAMTSSVTSMMLATLGAFVPGFVCEDAVEALARTTEALLLAIPERAKELAATDFDRIVYLGSGPLRALAEEAALKILELTGGRVLSHHESALGFRHGPKALLTERTLVVVLLSPDPHARLYDEDILAEMRTQLGASRVLAFSPDATDEAGAWCFGTGGGGGDWPPILPYLVAAQLLALQASIRAGRTPDNPFPGGEVNRVVQGVTIHPLPEQPA